MRESNSTNGFAPMGDPEPTSKSLGANGSDDILSDSTRSVKSKSKPSKKQRIVKSKPSKEQRIPLTKEQKIQYAFFTVLYILQVHTHGSTHWMSCSYKRTVLLCLKANWWLRSQVHAA